jgi:GntR family transcriptional repressor for pyruvate dehydrogenase complex
MAAKLPDNLTLKQPARLPQQVAEILAGEIARGGLAPGDKLPPESELASSFGVSRPVIREALALLRFEGLVDSRQGVGAVVLGPEHRSSFRVKPAEELKPADLAQLYELRAILEGEAASLAATRRGPAQLQRLGRCVEEMARAVAAGADGSGPDAEFHQGIAEASGNSHLSELMRYLHDRLAQVIRQARENSSRQAGLPELVQAEHQAMLEGIRDQRPEAAKQAALDHLKNAARRLGLRIFF